MFASIILKVPNSGIEWLDMMIISAKRDEIAEKAMQGLLAGYNSRDEIDFDAERDYDSIDSLVTKSYNIAAHMLVLSSEYDEEM